MGFDQYHEPPQELSEDTRTFVRVIHPWSKKQKQLTGMSSD